MKINLTAPVKATVASVVVISGIIIANTGFAGQTEAASTAAVKNVASVSVNF